MNNHEVVLELPIKTFLKKCPVVLHGISLLVTNPIHGTIPIASVGNLTLETEQGHRILDLRSYLPIATWNVLTLKLRRETQET